MALAVAAVMAGTGVAACGESETSGAAGDGGRDSLGPINLADCADWNRGSDEGRRRAIDDIHRFAAGPVPTSGGGGAVISAGEAYQLFENTCANDYARGFRLYKLYTRAASLGGP